MKDVNSMKKEEVIVTEFVPCNADIGHIIVKETECEPVLTIWTMIRQYRKRGQINTFVKSPLSFCYDPDDGFIPFFSIKLTEEECGNFIFKPMYATFPVKDQNKLVRITIPEAREFLIDHPEIFYGMENIPASTYSQYIYGQDINFNYDSDVQSSEEECPTLPLWKDLL